VRVACPEGFDLPQAVREEAARYARQSGGSVSYTHDQAAAIAGSRVVYAKAWGGPGDASLKAWMPTPGHFAGAASDAVLMHCLPVRRDVEVAAALLDSPRSAVVDEAENRFHAQRALLDWIFNG
jgi:N-acetylornithine carbamoyltransferase